MKYTDEDLERAEAAIDGWGRGGPNAADLAQLIADVRYDTLETAAVVVERFDEQVRTRVHMARRIRALRDER